MNRILLLAAILGMPCLVMGADASPPTLEFLPVPAKGLQTIAIGSCMDPKKPLTILDSITAAKPDLFILAGDNVYAKDESDDPELASLREAYDQLANAKEFQNLAQQVPLVAIWDDHDYGLNDAGADFAHRAASEELFERFWQVDPADASRSRPGVYREIQTGKAPETIQIILLDTRYFRTPLTQPATPPPNGHYAPSEDPEQSMLGDTQWAWLENVLAKPAALRIVVSSIQVLAEGHQWEAWRMLPREQARLITLLRATSGTTVIVSGDRHKAALYRQSSPEHGPLWELTTSSLNLPLSGFVSNITKETGPNLFDNEFYDANFGWIEVDWNQRTVSLQIRDETNQTIRQTTTPF